MKLTGPGNKIALLMHGAFGQPYGKLGESVLRYGRAENVCVIDRDSQLTRASQLASGLADVPVVKTVAEAKQLGADVLVLAIAPAGGLLPQEWRAEIVEALRLDMSLVNPLHAPLQNEAEFRNALQSGREIEDVRQEPSGLQPATGDARLLPNKRILTIGTDMSVGKMTASLELVKTLRSYGHSAEMVATGQVGMIVTGSGVPLDAVRVDFATGAIESEVLNVAKKADFIVIEGQGALCHPAASANLALMRGSMPTHLLFCHRAGQSHIRNRPWANIPEIPSLIALYEDMAACCGTFLKPKTVGVALNTAHLSENDAASAVNELEKESGLPVSDPVRFGSEKFLSRLVD
ncbi:MAG: DUF1611 domain-containing protein [Fimbriimonadales bacterium]